MVNNLPTDPRDLVIARNYAAAALHWFIVVMMLAMVSAYG